MALGAVTRSDLADPTPYTKSFFDLQLRFAHTVSALSGLPLARAILEYTNFYIRFGLGRDLGTILVAGVLALVAAWVLIGQ